MQDGDGTIHSLNQTEMNRLLGMAVAHYGYNRMFTPGLSTEFPVEYSVLSHGDIY